MRTPRSPRKVRSSKFRSPARRVAAHRNGLEMDFGTSQSAVIYPVNPFALGLAKSALSVKQRYPRYRQLVLVITKSMDGLEPGTSARVFPKGYTAPMDEEEAAAFFERTFRVNKNVIEFVNTEYQTDPDIAEAREKLFKLVGQIYFDIEAPRLSSIYLPIGLQEEFDAAGWSSTNVSFGLLSQYPDKVLNLGQQMDRDFAVNAGDPAPHVEVESNDRTAAYFMVNGPMDGNSFSLAPLSYRSDPGVTDDAILSILFQASLWDFERDGFVAGAKLIFALPEPTESEEEEEGRKKKSGPNQFTGKLPVQKSTGRMEEKNENEMVMGFTGTRKGMTDGQKTTFSKLLNELKPTHFVHGDCIGADADAHDAAIKAGVSVRIRPSTLTKQRAYVEGYDVEFPPKPPLERNKDIVNDANIMVACPSGYEEELRSGTWSTIRYSRRLNKPLIIVWPDGSKTDNRGSTPTRGVENSNIESASGNLLDAKVDALVNAVNCVGVMGKGIAKQFKERFPDMFTEYRKACKDNKVVPGKMHVYQNQEPDGPKYIINFPTKRDWRDNSRMEDIQSGLADLALTIRNLGIGSIAIPALGSGLGGLKWNDVRPKIEQALAPLSNVRIVVYEPNTSPGSARSNPARSKSISANVEELESEIVNDLKSRLMTRLDRYKKRPLDFVRLFNRVGFALPDFIENPLREMQEDNPNENILRAANEVIPDFIESVIGKIGELGIETKYVMGFDKWIGDPIQFRDVTAAREQVSRKFLPRNPAASLLMLYRMAASSRNIKFRDQAANILRVRSTFTVGARRKMESKEVTTSERRALGARVLSAEMKVRNFFPVVPITVDGRSVSPLKECVFTVYGLLNDINVDIMKARNQSTGGTDDEPQDAAYASYLYGVNSKEALSQSQKESMNFSQPGERAVNVMYSGGPRGSNRSLSNLAPRRFTYQGREYASVEHAYQTLKNNFDAQTYARPDDFVGRKVKAPRLDPSQGVDTNKLMRELVLASFVQNQKSAKELLSTGNKQITHVGNQNDHWTTEFPKILMEVREQLRQAETSTRSNSRKPARVRRNSGFPQYGIFYQTRMTVKEIHEAIEKERRTYLNSFITYPPSSVVPHPSFPMDYTPVDAYDYSSEILQQNKFFITHPSGLNAGKVVHAALGQVEYFARSRGPVLFDRFVNEIGQILKGGEESVEEGGITAWAQGSGLPVMNERGDEIQSYKNKAALLRAKTVDGKPVISKVLRPWVEGKETAVVYDLSRNLSFKAIADDFSPYLAIRKAICDRAWISSGGRAEDKAATSIYTEEDEDFAKLDIPFSIFGVLKADSSEVELLKRSLPKGVTPGTGASRFSLYTFNVKVPTPLGSRRPDPIAIQTLHGSDQDGFKVLKFKASKFMEVMTGLVQAGYNVTKSQLLPLVGTGNEKPNLFNSSNVFQSDIYYKLFDRARTRAQEKGDEINQEALAQKTYNTVVTMAVQTSNRPTVDENVDFERMGLFALGGTRVSPGEGSSRSQPGPGLMWATEDRFGFGSVYDLIFQFMMKSYPEVIEKTGVLAALRGKDLLPPASLPAREGESNLFSELSKSEGENGSISGTRRFINRIRTGQTETATLANAAEDYNVRPNMTYLVSVAGVLFEVATSLLDEGDEEGNPITRLDFRRVDVDNEESRLLVEAAKHEVNLDLPDEETFYQKGAEVQPLSADGLRNKLKEIQKQKEALISLRDRMDNDYRHQMNVGRLAMAIERSNDPEVATFAIPFLEELAKPNRSRTKVRRNPTFRGRHNPIEDDALMGLLVEYVSGRLSDDQVENLKTQLQTWAAAQDPDPTKWKVTRSAIQQMFPRQGREKPDKWSPETRVREGLGAGGHNLVSRLRRMSLTDADRSSAASAASADFPFEQDAGRDLMGRQAQLSVDEASKILAFQRDAVRREGPEGRYTMQAASGLCKTYRKRRLSTFSVPSNIIEFFNTNPNLPEGEMSTILILLSPRTTEPMLKPRVMVWRRGDHIDCDMLGEGPEDITEMLAKAIQSSLYWLAEKPSRRQEGKAKTTVYVARVGQNKIFTAWSPGDEVSVAQVKDNLKKPGIILKEIDSAAEVRRYIKAEQDLKIGTFKVDKKGTKPTPRSETRTTSTEERATEVRTELVRTSPRERVEFNADADYDALNFDEFRHMLVEEIDFSSEGDVELRFSSSPDFVGTRTDSFKFTHEGKPYMATRKTSKRGPPSKIFVARNMEGQVEEE